MTFPSPHPALARALDARNYTVPTAVQLAVLEANAAGRDLLVSAQTGSGKTVAFGLAMAATLLGQDEKFGRAAEPFALIIAPTRELAMQVQQELVWLYADTGARIITCVGGMDVRAEARQLASGAHIVVGTPGRLRDHLERKRLDLGKLKAIVLDEADEMLDLGFRDDLEFILDATPASRQTLLFSATMPREIETLARRYQREAIRIETLRRDEQHADIEYSAIRVAPNDVEHAVINILRFHEMRAALVFCATREAVKRLHARLLDRGFSAVALSGELTQSERTHALQAVRDGRARVLVATDVAARGLDLPDLTLVIHADLPNDRDTLLHRSGRTGRAGKKGLCTLIVPFNKRRKADVLLAAAKVKVTWGNAPTADEIRARDQERFMADAIFSEAPNDEDQVSARNLQTARTADEIALALVRLHRARLPAPEDLADDTGPPRRDRDDRRGPNSERAGRERSSNDRPRPERHERSSNDRPVRERARHDGPRPERHERSVERAHQSDRPGKPADRDRGPRPVHDDGREMIWYHLNIGREKMPIRAGYCR
jgi:ATP-dependent RNA helicase DeaD